MGLQACGPEACQQNYFHEVSLFSSNQACKQLVIANNSALNY